MAKIIGIAGGSGSGKSALVHRLADGMGARVLDLDSYYVDRTHVAPAERIGLNYDEPAATDVDLLLDHLGRLVGGEAIRKPLYSFQTHTRVGEERFGPADIVILEGLFTWWWQPVRRQLSLKVFVDAPADVRLARRLRRDVGERGRTVDDILHQYMATVRPMHHLYVEPCRRSADIVVSNDGSLDDAYDQLLGALRQAQDLRCGAMAANGQEGT